MNVQRALTGVLRIVSIHQAAILVHADLDMWCHLTDLHVLVCINRMHKIHRCAVFTNINEFSYVVNIVHISCHSITFS